MNRVKIILNYLLNFILSISIFLLVFCLVIKNNVYNKNNLYKVLEENNYYENVSNTIKDSMENYMVSSGLPESVLNEIYTEDILKNDINSYVDDFYSGKTNKVDTSSLENKLNNNIANYLSDHNVQVNDENAVELFIKDIAKIYKNNVKLYNLLDNYVNMFLKINKLLTIIMIINIICIVILIVVDLFIIKKSYMGCAFVASGLVILFIKLLFFDQIYYKNILVITENFSKIIGIVYSNLLKQLIISSIILFIVGIIIILIMSIKNNKVLKKSK